MCVHKFGGNIHTTINIGENSSENSLSPKSTCEIVLGVHVETRCYLVIGSFRNCVTAVNQELSDSLPSQCAPFLKVKFYQVYNGRLRFPQGRRFRVRISPLSDVPHGHDLTRPSSSCRTLLETQVLAPIAAFVRDSIDLLNKAHKPDRKGWYWCWKSSFH